MAKNGFNEKDDTLVLKKIQCTLQLDCRGLQVMINRQQEPYRDEKMGSKKKRVIDQSGFSERISGVCVIPLAQACRMTRRKNPPATMVKQVMVAAGRPDEKRCFCPDDEWDVTIAFLIMLSLDAQHIWFEHFPERR